MTERELLNRAHDGDAQAANDLAERYIGLAKHLANQFYYPGADYDDIVQQGLLGLMSGIRTWQPDVGTPVKPYLVICMERMMQTGLAVALRRKNLILTRATSLNASDVEENGEPIQRVELWAEVATGVDPCDEVVASETLGEVVAQVLALSPLERSVVVGFLAEGKSYRVLASKLGRSTKAIDNALQRAKRRIPELAA